jgi:hypothetical protein
MTMTGRLVDRVIRILAAVALLLLAVMSSPVPPARASHTAPPPNFLPRNPAIHKIGHRAHLAMSARPCLREAGSIQSDIEDDLDADIEDEVTVTSAPASVFLDVLPSPYPEPYSELVSFAVGLAARPLRC